MGSLNGLSGLSGIDGLTGAGGARLFYVDATGGNDANDGRSPATAWQTTTRVNSATFLPEDQILFKRGEVWAAADYLTLPLWEIPAPMPTLGAYDSGADPTINGYTPWWTPLDHGNLVAWWDAGDIDQADGSVVATWTGKLGNVASQGGGGLQPTLQTTAWVGEPAVRFDGIDDYLITAVNPPAPNGTIFIVYRPRAIATAWYAGCNGAAGTYCALRRLNNKDTWYLGTAGAGCTARFGQGDYTAHIVAINYDAANQKLMANGYEEFTGARAGAIPAVPLFIGGVNNNGGGVYGYGAIDISHVLVFNTKLSAGECRQVESYLARQQQYDPLYPSLWFADHDLATLDEWYVGQNFAETVGLVGVGSELIVAPVDGEAAVTSHVPDMSAGTPRATLARNHEFEDSGRTDLYFSFLFSYLVLPTNTTDWGPMIMQFKSVAPSDPLYFISWRWPWTGTLGLYRTTFVPPGIAAWIAPAGAVPVPVAGDWMHCEMRYNWNAVGDVQVWLDGVLCWNVAGADTRHNAGGSAGDFGVGLYGNAITPVDMTMYIRDVRVSETQLGPP